MKQSYVLTLRFLHRHTFSMSTNLACDCHIPTAHDPLEFKATGIFYGALERYRMTEHSFH